MSIVMLRAALKPPAHRLALCLALTAAASGCAGQRRMIGQDLISSLGRNSTYSDVFQVLGRPTHIDRERDGSRTMLYLRKCPEGSTATEPCASAPQGAPWQRCEFRFDPQDLWNGTACSWTGRP